MHRTLAQPVPSRLSAVTCVPLFGCYTVSLAWLGLHIGHKFSRSCVH